MSDARGIHDHPTFKLGRRPAVPGRPVLRLRDVLTGIVPAVGPADYLTGLRFGLFRNDEIGDCGPVSVANDRILVTSRLTPDRVHVPALAAVLDLYKRSGNPGFPADDNGVVLADMLAQVLKGGLDGVKCLAYAQVNVKDQAELDAAIAIFGGVLLGVTLQQAQQAQTDAGKWDYKPSNLWGGHAVLSGAETPVRVVTWAKGVTLTQAFVDHQLDEAWVVIWPEHLTDRGFLTGVDLAKLAQVYTALTGKNFPAVTPAPVPPPAPPPPPIPIPPAPPQPPPTPTPPMPNWKTVLDLLRKNLGKLLPVVLKDLPDVLAGKKTWDDLYKDLALALVGLSAHAPVGLSLSPEWLAVLKKYGTLLALDLLAGKSLKEIEADLAKALAA
jgi:hypothetical protein